MGACSPYFDSVFNAFNETITQENHENKDKLKMVLLIKECNHKTLQKMIDFVYKGPDALTHDIDDKNWEKLHEIGVEYEIYGLVETIMEKRKNLKDENENIHLEGNGTNFEEFLQKNKNVTLIDLDELLTETSVNGDTKMKWKEKADSKFD